jgi:hypothetical protein
MGPRSRIARISLARSAVSLAAMHGLIAPMRSSMATRGSRGAPMRGPRTAMGSGKGVWPGEAQPLRVLKQADPVR